MINENIYEKLANDFLAGKIKNLSKILKGGSARSFYKTKLNDENIIICQYSNLKRENFLYANIARFLKKYGFPVPNFYYHNQDKNIMIMEDIGSADLKNSENNHHLYIQTLHHIKNLHSTITQKYLEAPFELSPPFDEQLYQWEQNYFYEEFIQNECQSKKAYPANDFKKITDKLLSIPKVLLHRDLQSENIIINSDKTYFIDFQGMRFGNKYYDIASLLFDPYVSLDFQEILSLLRSYDDSPDEFMFFTASAQRLMQALGAYSFLANKQGKAHYKVFIKPALERLKFCAEHAKLDGILKCL